MMISMLSRVINLRVCRNGRGYYKGGDDEKIKDGFFHLPLMSSTSLLWLLERDTGKERELVLPCCLGGESTAS